MTPRAEAARVLRAPYLPDIGTTLRPPRLSVLRVNWPEAGSTVEASSLNTQEHPSGVTEGGRGKE